MGKYTIHLKGIDMPLGADIECDQYTVSENGNFVIFYIGNASGLLHFENVLMITPAALQYNNLTP